MSNTWPHFLQVEFSPHPQTLISFNTHCNHAPPFITTPSEWPITFNFSGKHLVRTYNLRVCYMHKRNLANNTGRGGGGQKWPWVLGNLFYKEVKFERAENCSDKTQVFHFLFSVYFLFAITQFSYHNQIPRLKKIEGAICPPCPPPQVTPMAICPANLILFNMMTLRLHAEYELWSSSLCSAHLLCLSTFLHFHILPPPPFPIWTFT
jgi:hypothetical protein